MKIAKLIIRGFQQFQDFHLDLTYPSNGQPLEKACFIGPNGTGKSTLLWLLHGEVLKGLTRIGLQQRLTASPQSIFCKISSASGSWWVHGPIGGSKGLLRETVENTDVWQALVNGDLSNNRSDLDHQHLALGPFRLAEAEASAVVGELSWRDNDSDLVIFSPPDSASLLPTGQRVPRASLNEALRLLHEFPVFQEVNTGRAGRFWNVLIYQIKKREADWQAYLSHSDNRAKSVEQAERDFQTDHPEILSEIANLWNRILAPAGLEFDYQNAKRPVQLNENLQAYVKLKASGKPLDYNALSTGIRNFLFRLGHIFALYFGRHIERGFLLLDEPENSLFPDFLYDLIDIYLGIIRNTQFFVATHNPIIAAQFRPAERVILDFDSAGRVTARRGVTPEGDDPNDVLKKDFEVRSLYGREGLAKWDRFLELRRLIKRTVDAAGKRQLIDEYMQIGNAYNFAADALPQEKT